MYRGIVTFWVAASHFVLLAVTYSLAAAQIKTPGRTGRLQHRKRGYFVAVCDFGVPTLVGAFSAAIGETAAVFDASTVERTTGKPFS
jgi:hypothetical protein